MQYLPVLEDPQLVAGTAIVLENNGFTIFTAGKRPSGTNPVGLNPDNVWSINGNIKPSAGLLPVPVVLPDDIPVRGFVSKTDMDTRHGEVTPVYNVLDGANVPADILDGPLYNSEFIGPSPSSGTYTLPRDALVALTNGWRETTMNSMKGMRNGTTEPWPLSLEATTWVLCPTDLMA